MKRGKEGRLKEKQMKVKEMRMKNKEKQIKNSEKPAAKQPVKTIVKHVHHRINKEMMKKAIERGVKLEMAKKKKTTTTTTTTFNVQKELAAKAHARELQWRADSLAAAAAEAQQQRMMQKKTVMMQRKTMMIAERRAARANAKELQVKADELTQKSRHARVDQHVISQRVATATHIEHSFSRSQKANLWETAANAAEHASMLTRQAGKAEKMRENKTKVLVNTLKLQAKRTKSVAERKELLAKASQKTKSWKEHDAKISKRMQAERTKLEKARQQSDWPYPKPKPKPKQRLTLDDARELGSASPTWEGMG